MKKLILILMMLLTSLHLNAQKGDYKPIYGSFVYKHANAYDIYGGEIGVKYVTFGVGKLMYSDEFYSEYKDLIEEPVIIDAGGIISFKNRSGHLLWIINPNISFAAGKVEICQEQELVATSTVGAGLTTGTVINGLTIQLGVSNIFSDNIQSCLKLGFGGIYRKHHKEESHEYREALEKREKYINNHVEDWY